MPLDPSLNFKAAKAQSVAPEAFARALDEEAARWKKLNDTDPCVRPIRLAAGVIRQLNALYLKEVGRGAITFQLVVRERTRVREQADKIAALERELVKARAENVALKAVASGRKASRTLFMRDGSGELLEAKTIFEDVVPG